METRVMQEESQELLASRGMPGVVKGDVKVQRMLRTKPTGEIQKMKEFSVGQLYDLNNIPDGANREFEFYLQCVSDGPRADIARYIHQHYLGR